MWRAIGPRAIGWRALLPLLLLPCFPSLRVPAVRAAVAHAAAVSQTNAQTPVDIDALGPKVGDRLPGFSLPDQHGHEHSLQSLLGPKGAVIVFFRSADW
jgi:hypothetical protein